jgi:hypothetical protein
VSQLRSVTIPPLAFHGDVSVTVIIVAAAGPVSVHARRPPIADRGDAHGMTVRTAAGHSVEVSPCRQCCDALPFAIRDDTKYDTGYAPPAKWGWGDLPLSCGPAQRQSVSRTQEAGTAPNFDGGQRSARHVQLRFVVHIALLAAFAASLATVTIITEGLPHLVVGSAFVGLVLIHIGQRRHTVVRLAASLGRPRTWLKRRGRMAWSDLVLTLLALNVLISGIYDLSTGAQVILHPRSAGIPFRDIGWHVSAALLLLGYLCVHVSRRWGRIHRSVIR